MHRLGFFLLKISLYYILKKKKRHFLCSGKFRGVPEISMFSLFSTAIFLETNLFFRYHDNFQVFSFILLQSETDTFSG